MKKNNIFVSLSIIIIVKIWQKRFGKNYNKKRNIICRFYPTCSEYSIIALNKYGFFKGWFLTYTRFKRCTDNNCDTTIDLP